MSHFADINWLAIVLATVASMALGMAWYTILGNQWMAALGKTREELMPDGKASSMPFVIAGVCQLVMAYFMLLVDALNYGNQRDRYSDYRCAACWRAYVVWFCFDIHDAQSCLSRTKESADHY